MRAYILAFALGVWLLQQQAELPDIRWAWALLPGAVCALLLSRCRAQHFYRNGQSIIGWCLAGYGVFLGGCFRPVALGRCAPA